MISKIFRMVFIIFGVCSVCLISFASGDEHNGMVEGYLLDADTKAPLIGANIIIVNSMMGASTNEKGFFIIKDIPVGSYSLRFSYIGYESVIKTDVIIRPRRITFLDVQMEISSIESEEVVVTAGYFSHIDEQPLSVSQFSREEIRRAPGSAGDVSRIIQSLPSIAKVDDQSNNLAVRGGNPIENTFFVDNIEIPNINHFPAQGSSGGPIGIINVDLIKDVEFYTGGFSASYGDRLSSVMNISFREGNRSQFEGQMDLNFAGFGGVFEGPLSNGKGSYLVSARRSYLDFLIDKIDVGSTVAPTYGDLQGKFVYDIDQNNQLIFLGVFADDHMKSDQQNAISNKMVFYAQQDIYQYTAGINWRRIWQKSGYSHTSLAYVSSIFDEDIFETGTGMQMKQNRSHEQSVHLRNSNHFRLSKRGSIEFGIEVKHLAGIYDNWYADDTDAFGNPVPSLIIDNKIGFTRFGAYLNYTFEPWKRVTTTFGLRTDFATYSNRASVSPRLAMSYRLSNRMSLNASAGLFYQNLPLLFIAANDKKKVLKDLLSLHFIVGIEYLITASTRLSLEIYQKYYENFPSELKQESLFLLDEILYRDGFSFNHEEISSDGKAESRGLELMLQKKLASDFYGLLSFSYSRSRYRGEAGKWRNRIFDNRILFSMEGGYKPSSLWEFSVRWIFAGGRPYTPFNIVASHAQNRSVLDEQRINEERYPDYHSLNIRVDRRFHFSKSNLVTYLSVWNAYHRKNIAAYFWNQIENKPDIIYQWGILPIFGLEYEF